MNTHIRKEYVYRKLNELKDAIEMDSYNLNRNEQDSLEIALEEFKNKLDMTYAKK